MTLPEFGGEFPSSIALGDVVLSGRDAAVFDARWDAAGADAASPAGVPTLALVVRADAADSFAIGFGARSDGREPFAGFDTLDVVVDASNGLALPSRGLVPDAAAAGVAAYTDCAAGPIDAAARVPLARLDGVGALYNTSIAFASPDADAAVRVGFNARVLRFEPGHGLTTEKDAGEWLRVAGQLLTIASVDGDDVTFEEAYNGSQVQASWPEVAVHAPGARRARYVGGSGTPTLTFRYVVVEGDETDALDLTDGAGGWTPFRLDGGAWVRRASSEPTTDVDLTLSASIADDRTLAVATPRPRVLNVTSTKPRGVLAVGERVDVTLHFSAPVVVWEPDAADYYDVVRFGAAPSWQAAGLDGPLSLIHI